jgi:hypothetical protein
MEEAMSNDADPHAKSNAQVAAVVGAITSTLLALHNERFAEGAERESYEAAPIWMQRQANHLTASVIAALDGLPA